MFDSKNIFQDFPLLQQTGPDGKRICYLDSGATSQKPESVINAITEYYRDYKANVHRGIYAISERATEATEITRKKIRDFIHAKSVSEIIYTRNATEAVNLVARTWGEANLKAGDTVLLSQMEHHSNLVPWYMLAEKSGVKVEFIPVTDEYQLDMDAWQDLLKRCAPPPWTGCAGMRSRADG